MHDPTSPTSRQAPTPGPAWWQRPLALAGVCLLLAVLWEGVKGLGGDPWRVTVGTPTPISIQFTPPFSLAFASDLNMPHLWDIAAAFLQPAQRHGPLLSSILLQAAGYTACAAGIGFALGALLGLGLGTLFAHVALLERGLMPYVVASQTVPIVAIAPMIVVWLQAGWWSVAMIAAYLAFFPVTINTLRGLRSPDPRALELLQSYAASRWTTLWKLRLPVALPAIFTALKIAGTASAVGAIIGELPSGIRDGLGGAILHFNQYYIAGPAKLWAAIVATAFVGGLFFLATALSEHIVLRQARRRVET